MGWNVSKDQETMTLIKQIWKRKQLNEKLKKMILKTQWTVSTTDIAENGISSL